MGSVVAIALGRYLDISLASGRGINTSVLQELQRALMQSRADAPVQDDERRVSCLLDEMCIQHQDDICRIISRSSEALTALETHKQELLNRVLAIEGRHAALDNLDLSAIEATLSHSRNLIVSLQARGDDLDLQVACESELRAAAAEEVRYFLLARVPCVLCSRRGAAASAPPYPCAPRPSPATLEGRPPSMCIQTRALRLKSDGLLQRLQSMILSAASLEADMQRAQQCHDAELARAHQVQQQTADAVYTLRRARKQDGVELALLAAELRQADEARATAIPVPCMPRGADDPTLGLKAGDALNSRLSHGKDAPAKESSGTPFLPDVADDSDATCMSISVCDGDSLGIRREEIDSVQHPPVSHVAPAAPPAMATMIERVGALDAHSHKAPAASRAPDAPPIQCAGGNTLLAGHSKLTAPTSSKPTSLHKPPASKPTARPAQRIRAAVAPPPSRPLLHRGLPSACLAPSPLRGSSEHDTGTTASRSTVGSTSPTTGALTGELAPDIMRAVAAFGLGDAIARLHQPLPYGGRMASALPSLQPALARSDCAVSPISVITNPIPEPWYKQQPYVQAWPPKDLAARASPPPLAHRKRKHTHERGPQLMDILASDRQSPKPDGSLPRHATSSKLSRQTPPPSRPAPPHQPRDPEPTPIGEDEHTQGGDEPGHPGRAPAAVLGAPLREEALRSHTLRHARPPRKQPSARRVLDLFGDEF
jgi:hypothetical protein